jgi:hypothetical protein
MPLNFQVIENAFSFLLFEVAIDFAELLDAHEGRFLAGVGALYFQELDS